LTWRICVWKL